MADKTLIEWTDATWNPITGCTLVDDGCRHCYAARLTATRLKHHPSREGLARFNAAGEAKFTGEVRFNEQWIDAPMRWRKPRMIFVCAHGDLFHPAVPDEWIDRVFAVMALAPQHTFQVLTKRPERALTYLTLVSPQGAMKRIFDTSDAETRVRRAMTNMLSKVPPAQLNIASAIQEERGDGFMPLWPLPNVWLGTSVSDQASADARIPALLNTPAAVRFVSAEPLLGPVDLTVIDNGLSGHARGVCALSGYMGCGMYGDYGPKLNWVIVGGESGPGARPMEPDWARALRDQCADNKVAFFMKQMGGERNMPPIPDDLMIREFPGGAR